MSAMIKKLFSGKRIEKAIKVIGNLLMLLSIVFIVKFIAEADIDFKTFTELRVLAGAFLLGVSIAAGNVMLALAWKTNLEMFTDVPIHATQIIKIYTRSNLSRYIPGNVMHLATRNILGKELGLSQKDMAVSSIVEIILQVATVAALILSLVAKTLYATVSQAIADGMIRSEWLIIVAVGILIVISVLTWMLKKRRRLFASLKSANILKSALLYAIFFSINALSFLAMVYLLDNTGLAGYTLSNVAGFYLIAWFLGFITPGAPGGLGIREYVLLLLLSPVFGDSAVLLFAVSMRIVTIMGDGFAFAFGSLIARNADRKDDIHGSNSSC